MIQHFKSIVPLFFNVAVNVHQNIQYLKLPVLAAVTDTMREFLR